MRVAGEVNTDADGRCDALQNQVVQLTGFKVAREQAVVFDASFHTTLAVHGLGVLLGVRERLLCAAEQRKDTHADCEDAEFHAGPPQRGRILR